MRNTTNTIDVAQQYRTNILSHKPGGHRIAVIMKSGFKLIYNNIKYPESYAAAIHGDDVREVVILGQ